MPTWLMTRPWLSSEMRVTLMKCSTRELRRGYRRMMRVMSDMPSSHTLQGETVRRVHSRRLQGVEGAW